MTQALLLALFYAFSLCYTLSIMQPRHAVRAVLLDQNHQVAIIYVQKYNYYKIPGGGVEPNEDLLRAAQREILEETGCNSEIVTHLGQIETDLPDWNIHDVSDGVIARVLGEKRPPQFEVHETERGFTLQWSPSLDDAIRLFESHHDIADPTAALLQARELKFLKLAHSRFTKIA